VIPPERQAAIASRLEEGVGFRSDVGDFVFKFACLPSGHDLEYALEQLKEGDDGYKRAIGIVLDGIA
jgi:hypothetical protein